MKAAKPANPTPKTRKQTQLFWLKTITLVMATTLSLLGSIGQFFFIESYDDVIGARTAEMRDIEAHAATLRATQAEYFNSYVQANLLFALNPADITVNKGITGQMYRLAILDRAFPFRAILGEMAMAGLFEFKTVNDQYRTLSEAARADFSYASYSALNAFEKDILDRALTLQHNMQDRFFGAQAEKAEAEAARDKRHLWLTLMTAIGTILLLAANLMEERKKVA
jgi:hypothetical protein